jgi:hypothetical protein
MKGLQPAGQLTLAYEALRAQATGQLPPVTPRGLALFLAEGFPAWLNIWKPEVIAALKTLPAPCQQQPPAGLGGEMVRVLTEMALGCQKGWTT